jgi:pimeloyl-ACP methyl ester carboxylesterase
MGAGTAVRFCVQHRQRVDKLVLVACAGLPNPIPLMAKVGNLPGIGELFLGWKSDAFRRMGLGMSFIHNKALLTDRYLENVTRAQKISGSSEVGLAILRKQFFDKLSDEIHRLAGMDVPVLIVWGREDKAIPLRCGRELHHILQGSRLEILDNAGHVPNFERAEEFNRLAMEFLGG